MESWPYGETCAVLAWQRTRKIVRARRWECGVSCDCSIKNGAKRVELGLAWVSASITVKWSLAILARTSAWIPQSLATQRISHRELRVLLEFMASIYWSATAAELVRDEVCLRSVARVQVKGKSK